MRKLLALLLMLCALPAMSAEVRDPENHFFQPKLGDFKAELDTARAQGKKGIFVFFEMDACPFCARMKATILNQVDVQEAYSAQFLNFSVDVNGDVPMTDFLGRETTEKHFAFENRARATPTMVFFDLTGKPVARYIGPSKDKAEFMLLGRYVSSGAYAAGPFIKYKQAQ